MAQSFFLFYLIRLHCKANILFICFYCVNICVYAILLPVSLSGTINFSAQRDAINRLL